MEVLLGILHTDTIQFYLSVPFIVYQDQWTKLTAGKQTYH